MPRNGSGTYTLPAGNPVVTGTTISSTVQNNTMSDLASEMTNSVDKDGQTVITGTIDFNGNKIVLDADGDTSITSSTDDVIDIEVEGVDAVKIGWQSVADTGFITVDPKAFTADATENTHRIAILNANAITVPTGTTALASAVYVTEPNLIATGTITNAATIYVKAAPTEGATNYAVWVASGDARLGGDLIVDNFIRTPLIGDLTIATAAITVTGSTHRVDTEGGASTDTLSTINGGAVDGNILFLSTVSGLRDVTIDNAGNMFVAGGSVTLNGSADAVMLKYSGAENKWIMISHSDNA